MTQATATIIPTNVLAVAAFEFTFFPEDSDNYAEAEWSRNAVGQRKGTNRLAVRTESGTGIRVKNARMMVPPAGYIQNLPVGRLCVNLCFIYVGKNRSRSHHHCSHRGCNNHCTYGKDDTCIQRGTEFLNRPGECRCTVTSPSFCRASHHAYNGRQDTDRSCKNISDNTAVTAGLFCIPGRKYRLKHRLHNGRKGKPPTAQANICCVGIAGTISLS